MPLMHVKLKFPQWVMLGYLLILMGASVCIGIDPIRSLNDSLVKFAMNGVLVLALIPMINAGMGINFGLPIGVTAGTLGMLIAIEFRLSGVLGFTMAVGIGAIWAVILGFLYSHLLNHLKGNEEIVSMFVGYAFIPLVNIFYTLAPFTNRQMLYPVGGAGLRPKINLEGYFADLLDKTWSIALGPVLIPVGLLLAYGLVAFLLYKLEKTQLGDQMAAVSENELFAALSGIRVNQTRIIAVIISTVIAAFGICVYAQSYGFVESYDGPNNLIFPAVSAILIGGASRHKATIWHAILGTLLYQTTYLLSVPVANALLLPQMAEILRMLVTNSIILYAFFYEGRSTREAI